MLVAVLVLATQATVDYETVAKPLAAVLEELSTKTGIELRASKSLENEMLVVSVRDADLAILREKIATALCGKWSEKDGVFTIQSDEIETKRRRSAAEKVIVEGIVEGRGPRFQLRLPQYDNATVEKWAQAFAAPRAGSFLCESALRQLDIGALLQIPFGERRIYSTRPNRWQLPITGMDDALVSALTFHNDVAAKAASANVNEPAAGTPQYEMRRQLITTWKSPLKVLAIAERNQSAIIVSMMVIDGDGNTVQHRSEFLPVWMHKPKLEIPANSEKAITLSKAAKSLSDLMSVKGKSLASDGRFVIDEDSLNRLRSPSKFDPLTFHYSEQLLGLAKNTKWNLVAHVQDDMVDLTMLPQPTTESVAQGLQTSMTTSYELKDSWLCISPTNLNSTQQIDRSALQSLLDSTRNKAAGVSDLGRIAASSPDPGTTPLLVPYLHLAHASSYGGRMWYDLRFMHSLPTEVKEVAFKGGSVAAGNFGSTHARAFQQWVYYTCNPDFSVNGAPNYCGEIRRANEEPTEVIPNGVPPNSVLRFVRENDKALLSSPSEPNAVNGSPFSIRTVGFFKMIDPSEYEDSSPPQFEKFWIGEQTIIRLLLQPSETYVLRGAVVDWRIDLSGDPKTLASSPKAFQDAYDKALKDAIARRGGG